MHNLVARDGTVCWPSPRRQSGSLRCDTVLLNTFINVRHVKCVTVRMGVDSELLICLPLAAVSALMVELVGDVVGVPVRLANALLERTRRVIRRG